METGDTLLQVFTGVTAYVVQLNNHKWFADVYLSSTVLQAKQIVEANTNQVNKLVQPASETPDICGVRRIYTTCKDLKPSVHIGGRLYSST